MEESTSEIEEIKTSLKQSESKYYSDSIESEKGKAETISQFSQNDKLEMGKVTAQKISVD